MHGGASAAALCRADARQGPALCLRLRRQERRQAGILVRACAVRRRRRSASNWCAAMRRSKSSAKSLTKRLSPQQRATATSLEKPDWLDRMRPRDAPAPRLIRPFDAAGVDEPSVFSPLDSDKRFRRGLLVHALLARLARHCASRTLSHAQSGICARQKLDEVEAGALICRNRCRAGRSGFRGRLRAGQPRRSRHCRRPAGTRRGRARQWPHRPPGGDGRRGADRRFQDQSPAAARTRAMCRRYTRRRWRSIAPRRRKSFPGKRIVCGLVWTDGPTLMQLSNGLLGRRIGANPRAP